MAKLSKRARLIREKVDVTKEYDISEAVALLKELIAKVALCPIEVFLSSLKFTISSTPNKTLLWNKLL